MGVGMVTVVMAGVESSSDFSSSIRGTAGASDDRSFRIFLYYKTDVHTLLKQEGQVCKFVLQYLLKLEAHSGTCMMAV